MGMFVENETAVVHSAVEMHRQLRESGNRRGRAKQHDATVVLDDMTRNVEITVKPRVQQRRAVDLHLEGAEVGSDPLGIRLEVQAGRIGMCADDSKPVVAAL